MGKCKDCRYSETSTFKVKNSTVITTVCTLTSIVVDPDTSCEYYNADLSGQDICYNCKYYLGGCDWGLFCSHKDNYYRLGNFNDGPCKHYERKGVENVQRPNQFGRG